MPDCEGELTQFSRALKTLDIQIIHANTPQAKGRVERANKTLQDRLVKGMRQVNPVPMPPQKPQEDSMATNHPEVFLLSDKQESL